MKGNTIIIGIRNKSMNMGKERKIAPKSNTKINRSAVMHKSANSTNPTIPTFKKGFVTTLPFTFIICFNP